MMVRTLVFSTILALSGCATAPEVYLTQDPIEVTEAELARYWQPSAEFVTYRAPIYRTARPRADGVVTVRYLIDSNGRTFEPEVVESSPPGLWDRSALKAAAAFAYRPVQGNDGLTPVIVTQQITFADNFSR